MEFNRDISIVAINAWNLGTPPTQNNIKNIDPLTANKSKKLENLLQCLDISSKNYPTSSQPKRDSFSVLECFAATGLRSIRYAKEIYGVTKIVANDLDPQAVLLINQSAKDNNVQSIVNGNIGDAKRVLYGCIGGELYDVVDLDPYGSSSPFLDGAVQAVANGGLLCVTCTDLSVLAGSQPEACWSKYGGINIPNAPFTHELALRILVSSIQSTAARYKRSAEPIMCCSIDYYVRVFIVIRDNPKQVQKLASQSGIVYQCSGCTTFQIQPIGKYIVDGKSIKTGPAQIACDKNCKTCGNTCHIGGPFFTGPLHSKPFVAEMMRVLLKSYDMFGTYERMAGMLAVIIEELDDTPLYFVLPRLCGVLHVGTPSLDKFLSAICNADFRFSQSHCIPYAIKTNAPWKCSLIV
jgi:tRNA (guanine26-N2/guanine27-N2)-dimethyltransferase